MTSSAELKNLSLKTGHFAPNFMCDMDGSKRATLSDLRGKNVVLYFYPKDDTPGCTIEAKDFSEFTKEFNDANAVVIGVSRDDVKSHDKFKAKYNLNFDLAYDETGSICEAYGVWVEKAMYGRKYMGIERTTFLINSEGKIVRIWNKVKVEAHVQEVLEAVKNLG